MKNEFIMSIFFGSSMKEVILDVAKFFALLFIGLFFIGLLRLMIIENKDFKLIFLPPILDMAGT